MAVKKTKRRVRRTATAKGIHAPSTLTRKAPSARLVARRKKTARAPLGFYANPTTPRAKPGGSTELYRGSVIPSQNGKVFAVVYGGIILSLFSTRREADTRLELLQSRGP